MKRYLLIGALMAAAPGLALAQDYEYDDIGPDSGDQEFTISGTGSSDQDFDTGSAGVTGELGWYLSEELEIGIRQSVNFSDTAGGGTAWNGATRGFVDWHFFTDSRFRPFVGGSLGGIYGDGIDETAFAGLEGGVKYYVLPRTFILGRAEYQFFFDSASGADEGFEDGAFAYSVGVGYNF